MAGFSCAASREYDSSVEVDENDDVIENPRNKGLLMGNELDRYLIENNHDGVMILEMLNPYKHENIIGDKYIELMVKNSTQIKSAIGNNGQFDGTNPDIRFSRTNATQAQYEQRIDDIFAGKTFRDQVRVLDRSDLLDMLGYGNQEVVLVNSKVNAEKHSNMTAEQWKKVPEWLDNPSMVFHSDTVAGRLVFIAPESVENNPVKIILEPKGGKLEAHVLLNAYDMSVDEESKVNHSNPFTTFAHWRDTDKLLYIDKEKTSRLASRLGLLLPQRLLQPTGRVKILTEKNLQGYRKNTPFDENQTRNSQSPNPVSDRAAATKIAAYQTAISGSLKNHAHLINVVSRDDLVRPENAEKLQGVEGFYNPTNGQITLIAESLRSPAHAQFVAWHELAHRKIHVSQAQEWHNAIAQAAKHETVRKLADKIQEYRKNTDDPAATNRAVAHEEAIAELYAAHETGDYVALKEKYKIKIPRVIQNNLGGFLARLGDKLASIVKHALGLNVDNHADVFELLHNLQQLNVSGSLNEAETRTQYSRENNNETVIEQAGKRLARIAQAIQNGAKYISNEPIHLGSTPDVLVRLGVPQRPMRIVDTKKLFQTAGSRNQDDHGLTPDVLGEFPKAMQNPLAVFDSATQENAKVLVVELKDSQDRPIIAAIHVDKRQGFNQINKIASIYGRNNAEETFNRWTDDGLLRYLNDEKSHSVLTSFGLQLPTEKSMNGMVDNVLLASEFVNSGSLKNSTGVIRNSKLQNIQAQGIDEQAEILQGEPVSVIDEQELDLPLQGGFQAVTQWASDLFTQQGNVAENPLLGQIELNERSVKDSLAHGRLNPYKNMAFAAVKDVLEKGALIAKDTNQFKENSYYVSAPILMNGKENILTVTVREDSTTRRMYLHSVMLKENLLTPRVSSTLEKTSRTHSGSLTSADIHNILQKALTYKPENSDSLKFSRGTSKDQIAQFAQTGKIEQDLGLIEAVRTDRTADYLAGKKTAMGKVRDFLVEGFADNLIKVSDWIDSLSIAEMQRELFKQSMYRAGGMRDYQNQIITEQFIQPMNKELARIAKKTKRPMIEVKRLVGVWGSANYAPTANARLLQRAKAELDQAKADGASQAKIDELQAAYNERQAAINGTADGKTTAAKVGLSVWGQPEKIKNAWNGTALGFANAALARNDNFMVLDEIAECEPHIIAKTTYSVINGKSKLQGAKDGGNRQQSEWRILIFSTGEYDLKNYIERGGMKWEAGQSVRLPSLPAMVRYGVYDHLHGFHNGAALSDHLLHAINEQHGAADKAWIEKLLTLNTERIHAARNAFMQILPELNGQALRVARRFATVAAALELANEVTGLAAGVGMAGVKKCFDDWYSINGNMDYETRAILDQAENFMQLYGESSRFVEWYSHYTNHDHAGYYKELDEKEKRKEYWIIPSVFESEVLRHTDTQNGYLVLHGVGWLQKPKSGKGWKQQRYLKGRFYVLIGVEPPHCDCDD